MEFYIVLEVQGYADGTKAIVPPTFYDDLAHAESAWHYVMAVAALSETAYHACYVIRNDGTIVYGKVYDRRTQEVTND